MYAISKEFAFSASHQLNDLPVDHQCSRMHGHNYIVRITCAAPTLDRVGFVIDYGDLAPLKDLIDKRLDHRHLNHVLDFNPTAENLAYWLFQQAREVGWPVFEVAVSETPKTWAAYRA